MIYTTFAKLDKLQLVLLKPYASVAHDYLFLTKYAHFKCFDKHMYTISTSEDDELTVIVTARLAKCYLFTFQKYHFTGE